MWETTSAELAASELRYPNNPDWDHRRSAYCLKELSLKATSNGYYEPSHSGFVVGGTGHQSQKGIMQLMQLGMKICLENLISNPTL
jgi:hypothetical protein